VTSLDAIAEQQSEKVTRGRPRDESKNIAIIDAASRLFLERGFDGTSMDEVAKRAGVSKQTVYSHFSSKELLFSEAIHVTIEKYYPETATRNVKDHSLETDLRAVCENYARLLSGDDAIAMFRLLVTAAGKTQKLAELFYEAGPRAMKAKLAEFLQHWVDNGDLIINDMDRACNRLITLVKGHFHFVRSIGLVDTISEEDLQKDVDDAVEAFLRIYRRP